MKLFGYTLGTLCLAIATMNAHAVTLKYELTNIHSSNGAVNYPGLDFFNATSATLTVEKEMGQEPQVKTLTIQFPQINKLSASNFQRLPNSPEQQATVNNAWVYRQVDIRLDAMPIEANNSLHVMGFVAENSAFITPQTNNWNGHLFDLNGELVDVTPSKVADTASAVIDGKRVTFSLRDRLSQAPTGNMPNGPSEGYVVDIMWLGKGQARAYVPAPAQGPDRDFATAVSLTITGTENPDYQTWEIMVSGKDPFGGEMPPSAIRVMDLLNSAYPL